MTGKDNYTEALAALNIKVGERGMTVEEFQPIYEQFRVLVRALRVYKKRNEKYRDNWKRMGWRGQLIRIRERAERLWDEFWDKEDYAKEREMDRARALVNGVDTDYEDEPYEVDDAIDLINFAAFFVRATEAYNRDGEWWGGIK